MTKLSVNINKIAVVRNSRGGNLPDVVRAALDIERFGAEGITVHPRPDARHIRYNDVRDLKRALTTELNIEGNPIPGFIDLVLEVVPAQVTLVPDAHDAITSNAGWDTLANRAFLTDVTARFHAKGIRVSVFVDPVAEMVAGAKACGVDCIGVRYGYAAEGELASAGVKELIVIAQDITRYGTDFNGEHQLPALLRELCKLDFHWIRLHYLYPDEITEELIDTIAEEKKIVPYLDIPIQHCNDGILKAMNRRDTKESLRKVFHDLRERVPGLVLRTSIIAGLPGEGEAEFEELCDFLREEKIERAGVFPFSPEEGTKAAAMEHVSTEEAQRRTELLVDVQSEIIDAYNDSVLGDIREVLCEGWSEESQSFVGRSYAESVDIDGKIYFSSNCDIMAGEFVNVRLTGTMDGELTGEAVE